MKRIFPYLISVLFALCVVLPASAQKNKLQGVWQQVQFTQNGQKVVHLPVWKVMQNDGSFCTFLIANPEGMSIQTTHGTYKVKSEKTLDERIIGSITDPDLIGKVNQLTYEFDGKDKLTVRYRLPGYQRDAVETWVRVKLEFPAP